LLTHRCAIQIGDISKAVVLVQNGFAHSQRNADWWAVKPVEGGRREVFVDVIHRRDDRREVRRAAREKESGVSEDLEAEAGSRQKSESGQSDQSWRHTPSVHLSTAPQSSSRPHSARIPAIRWHDPVSSGRGLFDARTQNTASRRSNSIWSSHLSGTSARSVRGSSRSPSMLAAKGCWSLRS
jgi:hypothetical protein